MCRKLMGSLGVTFLGKGGVKEAAEQIEKLGYGKGHK